MKHSFLNLSLSYCRMVDNGRTIQSTLDHMCKEVVELQEEVIKYRDDLPPGDDGVIGEAIDVMICACDIIYQKNPSISSDYLMTLIHAKLDKWKTVYGNPVVPTETPNPQV